MKPHKKVLEVIKRLRNECPAPKTALVYKNPFELLVATILSAQATDAHVNKVTEHLFKKYTSVRDYAEAGLDALQKDVSSINFYKTKASNIHKSAQVIVERFKGKVPKTMEELTTLPGVARKTANIVLSTAYGINEGIAVDTHVKRLAGRLGLTSNEDPVKIERDLMSITPKEEWGDLPRLLMIHGRNVCRAIKPDHKGCVLFDICPSSRIN